MHAPMADPFKTQVAEDGYRRGMTRVTEPMLASAESFIWLTGRVLEQRRFAFLFGSETPAAVHRALDAYRGADGGYAFGLEPDVRGPASQPVTLPAALRVLDEIGALDQAAAETVCVWLASVTAPDGGVPAVLPTLRAYPRPPWLPVPDAPAGDLLATGPIVGLLLKNGVEHPWLEHATTFCWRAVAEMREPTPTRLRPPSRSSTTHRTRRAPPSRLRTWDDWCASGGWSCSTPHTPARPP